MEIKINIDTRKKDGKTLLEYLSNLSYVTITYPEDDSELDARLLNAMKEGAKTKNVSKERIMKKLKRK
jgi:6-pyruvoyl-tetrahydropterin synthase